VVASKGAGCAVGVGVEKEGRRLPSWPIPISRPSLSAGLRAGCPTAWDKDLPVFTTKDAQANARRLRKSAGGRGRQMPS
jgi:hypothetical protein